MNTDRVHTAVRVSPHMHAWVRDTARRRGIPMNEVISTALYQHRWVPRLLKVQVVVLVAQLASLWWLA